MERSQVHFRMTPLSGKCEHDCVTEEAFGVDLVIAMLQVAAGAPLPWTQQELQARGPDVFDVPLNRVAERPPERGGRAGVRERDRKGGVRRRRHLESST